MNWPKKRRVSEWDIEMSRYTAVYDACVLYPAPLRDLLLELALTDLFKARVRADLEARGLVEPL